MLAHATCMNGRTTDSVRPSDAPGSIVNYDDKRFTSRDGITTGLRG